MKEASGELSMTAVAAVAIGAIAVIFTTLILPSLKSNITRSAKCSQAFNCVASTTNTDMNTCSYCEDDACTSTKKVECPKK